MCLSLCESPIGRGSGARGEYDLRQARHTILLSTLFGALLVAGCGDGRVARPEGTPLEIYDRAVSLFFRSPRRPEEATVLLAGACAHIKEQQAQSCYNWGLLLELEKDTRGALRAYRRAASLQATDVYVAAAEALDPDHQPAEGRLRALKRAVRLCADKREGQALEELKAGAARNPKAWNRELVSQPLFQECLGHTKGYAQFVGSLPKAGGSLEQQHRAALAARDPFHKLWDLESTFAGREPASTHAVTSAWHQALRSAARGDGAGAGQALARFQAAVSGAGAPADRARGMLKAAALVVEQTRYFAAVRSHPEVRSFVGRALGP